LLAIVLGTCFLPPSAVGSDLAGLVAAANLGPWPWSKMPPPWEHPSIDGGVQRSEELKGKVVMMYLFYDG